MSIDPAILGKRLKNARTNCRTTQDDAAKELGIPRTALVNIESGQRSVSTLEVSKLARLYRRSVGELLSDSADSDEDIFVVLHRIDQDFAEDPVVKEKVSQHVAICREGNGLRELLGISDEDGPPEYNLPAPQSTMDAVEQGNRVAAQERCRLSLGTNPLPI